MKTTVNGLVNLRECARQITKVLQEYDPKGKITHSYLSKLHKQGSISSYPVPGKKHNAYKFNEVLDFIKKTSPQRFIIREMQKEDKTIFDSDFLPSSSLADLTESQLSERSKIIAETETLKKSLGVEKDLLAGRDFVDVDLTEARAEKEYWLGQQAKIKYKETAGKKIDGDMAAQQAEKAFSIIRDGMFSSIPRISPQFDNPFEVTSILKDEFTKILEDAIMEIEKFNRIEV